MTLSKLAQLANVSVAVVSKAFSGREDVSEAMREHVFAVAECKNRNVGMKRVRNRDYDCINIFIEDCRFPVGIQNGIGISAQALGIYVTKRVKVHIFYFTLRNAGCVGTAHIANADYEDV